MNATRHQRVLRLLETACSLDFRFPWFSRINKTQLGSYEIQGSIGIHDPCGHCIPRTHGIQICGICGIMGSMGSTRCAGPMNPIESIASHWIFFRMWNPSHPHDPWDLQHPWDPQDAWDPWNKSAHEPHGVSFSLDLHSSHTFNRRSSDLHPLNFSFV